MNKSKLLSMILSGVMAFSMAGSIAAGAENVKTKEYSLTELENMSKEEFFELEGAEAQYNTWVKYVDNTYNSLLTNEDTADNAGDIKILYTRFSVNVRNDGKYKFLESEKKLKNLLGGREVEIESPVISEIPQWLNHFVIYDKDFSISKNEITDDDILFITKYQYCIRQVCDFSFYTWDTLPLSITAYGEANGDNILNIRDASFIAQKLASGKADELPDTADFNSDGKTDVRDAALIAQFMTARSAAKAEGLI
ncbi:dockerin type I repeat-containing protein [Porcipelethomonas sp.]|uniref:dockerin type I repeat-containing protein n=1 Tax=Porcipelethomonas sp. TaxID=2981675 RepID=UPI003EF92A18